MVFRKRSEVPRKAELKNGMAESMKTPCCLTELLSSLHSSVVFFKCSGNTCFVATTHWTFPTISAMMEESWDSPWLDKENIQMPSTQRWHSEQVAGLWPTCRSRALKICSMLTSPSLSCFIQRWVWFKDRYCLAGCVSRQSSGVRSRMLVHVLQHKSAPDQGICMKPGLYSLLGL